MNSVANALAAFGLLLLALVGLGMSLCGGFTTVIGATQSDSSLLLFSVPSLLLGLSLVWTAGGRLLRRVRSSSAGVRPTDATAVDE